MSLALALLLAVAAAPGSATEALQARAAEVRAELPPKGEAITPAVRAKLEKLLTRTVDLRAMAKAALGHNWDKMTESQRKRLIGAFEKRFRSATTGDVEGYRSTEIAYKPEEKAGEDVVKVPTEMTIQGEPTEISYAMRKGSEGWRIEDIVVDGVSTVANYRSSFARIINKDGVEALISKLEKGPQKGGSGGAGGAKASR
ncbi:MlaC/ttg2D family ABC transporter substrate-binding protein [Anaeromyxobacter paludicola]|uniref:ABC transporter substrate-binding protein n=1 Tax=Anaeromyxobacter paludicola TaxID=2918171 RepID=A0ABM7XEU1_9BACT|nr:ABC transporter substrate-binding protein [Anaeromyxobacter paludicola]BDG10371.1 ABC transporter substrate-binding protein [Anaeromyxobacter paludicola]